ncbi:chromosomal replication initiator DnaA [Lichenicoccus sp.]|uniref:chromosomal replication initiator DnaA n=1 Tax=Lichenicoccus sp. TaxID=2781899 RepID=UPI003D11BED0
MRESGERPGGEHGAQRQLALPFAHRPRFARADFIAAPSNAAALAWLERRRETDWPDHRLALWGAAGSGKTHLLQVWAQDHDALLLPGTALRGLTRLPERSGDAGGIAVDDADLAADERALLHLLNAAREDRLPILLSGRAPPARWEMRLPDLASRLRATAAVGLRQPEEGLLRILLQRLLAERQLAVAQPVVDWLLLRLPRRADAMREAARRLDQAALASGGAVTRSLAGLVLDELLIGPDEFVEDMPEGAPLL